MKYFFLTALSTICFFTKKINAQSEFFSELSVTKFFMLPNRNTIVVSPSAKHIYDDIGWRRYGVSGEFRHAISNWDLIGGIGNFYTFDNNIDNYFEFRPYLALRLNTPMGSKCRFGQIARTELRSFFYQNRDDNETKGRIRYAVNLLYTLSQQEKKAWKVRATCEWYVLKEVSYLERFVGSTEYTFEMIREFSEIKALSLAYKQEQFNKNFSINATTGHTIAIDFTF